MPDKRTARGSRLLMVFSAICILVALVLWALDLITTRGHHHGIVSVLGTPIVACLVLFNLWYLRRVANKR